MKATAAISARAHHGYLFRGATGNIEELTSNCIIVGAFDSAVFECSPTFVGRGDLIISYSDGLTDAENPSGETFGEAPRSRNIQNSAALGAKFGY
jgi:serine phosphatase RsbU (regulator of sigma subunit)